MSSVLLAVPSSYFICLPFSISRDHLYQKFLNLTSNGKKDDIIYIIKKVSSFVVDSSGCYCCQKSCYRTTFGVFRHTDHCFLSEQHESATRSLDDNVWEEFRNFKKCLIMVFAKQEKDLVFLETVMSLGRQKRHCLVECIPLPKDVAKQAPLYFKKVCKTILCYPFYFCSTVYQIYFGTSRN